MSQQLPRSSAKTFEIIKEVLNQNWIKIPEQFQGAGAPGNTLEFLLNVEQNNFDSPDLFDWEIKFHGGNSLVTLFHKDPQPRGIMNEIVNTFGWENEKNQISFRHTIRGRSERGFIIVNKDNKIYVKNENDDSIVPYWEHNTILGSIAAKLRRLILVEGTVNKKERSVIYDKATAYWDLNLLSICEAIEKGIIYIDFDARTKGERGTALRNHGTKFRIHLKNVGVLYANQQEII